MKVYARVVCARYNTQRLSGWDEVDELVEIFKEDGLRRRGELGQLLGIVGQGVTIEPPIDVVFGINTRMRDGGYANAGLRRHNHASVIVEDRVRIGSNVSLLTETHPTDVQERHEIWETAQKIVIGDDVWIGAVVTVLGGATISHGSVIGAGAVVVKDVSPRRVWMGVPARHAHDIHHTPLEEAAVLDPNREMSEECSRQRGPAPHDALETSDESDNSGDEI